jgi:hypothetical protein
MHKIDDINSILNAVNDINLKKKKKNSKSTVQQKDIIPKLNQDLIIPLDLDKIIREAEDYKKKSSFKYHQVNLIQEKNDILKLKNYNKNFEEIQTRIIEDLYTRFKKKIKKNTLKIIFDLNLKIKNLEKQLENFKIQKKQPINVNKHILENETVELSKKPDPSIISLNKVLSKNKNFLKDEIITSLKVQDSTILILNKKITNFKNTEEKLRAQIIDLEQDKTILLNKIKKFDELKIQQNDLNDTKEKLIAIYKQVEKQKMIFLDLKNHSAKIEQNSNFFKENYEKLIIENNDVKIRLIIAKEQISVHESNKRDLLLAINQLNEISSKSNIALKISPPKLSSEENILKLRKKFEITE